MAESSQVDVGVERLLVLVKVTIRYQSGRVIGPEADHGHDKDDTERRLPRLGPIFTPLRCLIAQQDLT